MLRSNFVNEHFINHTSQLVHIHLTRPRAWVNLAGIGDCDSTPVTNLECITTLVVHICGATLYTITTGNVVAILETLTQKQNQTGNDLSELGGLMQACGVPSGDQKRILQGYMMHNLVVKASESDDENATSRTPAVPEAVRRLPPHLRQEVACYVRAEAIKRRDPAFAHCSNEFLSALVAALKSKVFLLTGDYFCKENEMLPRQVIFVEKGAMEVIANGRCIRTLERGDVIGKRWLLEAGKGEICCGDENETSAADKKSVTFSTSTSLRALRECVLLTGFADRSDVEDLASRYETDFFLLKADRDRVNAMRRRREEGQRHKLQRAAKKAAVVMRLAKPGGAADSNCMKSTTVDDSAVPYDAGAKKKTKNSSPRRASSILHPRRLSVRLRGKDR